MTIKMLTLEEVAEVLRMESTTTVSRLIKTGKLKATRPAGRWLVRETDLEAMLTEHQSGAA